MITHPAVLGWLIQHFHLYLLRNITVRATLAAVTAFALSLLLGPLMIRWLQSRQIRERVEKKDSARLTEIHAPKGGTPTQGGLLIVLVMMVSLFLFGRLDNLFVLVAFLVILGSTLIGWVDDHIKLTGQVRKGLSKSEKLGLQFLLYGVAAVGLWYAQEPGTPPAISLPFVKRSLAPGMFLYCAWGAFVMALASNAVNLTDGLDGLAAGCSAMTGLALSIVAYAAGHAGLSRYLLIPSVPGCGELAVLGGALVGASLGFLWFNCHPAEVFMGNTGSVVLGGVIGYMAFAARQEMALLLLGAVFMVEVASVVLQVASFRIFGRRILRIAPIHHHFEFGGWKEEKVTVRFWILSAILAILLVLTLKIR